LSTTVNGGSNSNLPQSQSHLGVSETHDLSDSFTVTKNTQITVSVTIGNATSVYSDYYLRHTNLFNSIHIVEENSGRTYGVCSFAPYLYYNNYNAHRDFLIGKSYYGSASVPPGTYKIKITMSLNSELD
jgi:hypothetical protein